MPITVKERTWNKKSASQEGINRNNLNSLPYSIGDYALLRLIGEGGMGTVYEGIHTRLGKKVAIKLLPADRLGDAESLDRFAQEMKAVGQLSHPNIVQAFDAREEKGAYFLVLEFLEGIDLGRLSRLNTSYQIADACEIVFQVAQGLEHIQQYGLVHRDIKPSNLFFSVKHNSNQEVVSTEMKILDLGLARFTSIANAEELTVTGQLLGTFDYMSPEQINNSRSVDIHSDLYSLGCTLYFLLTGKAPFGDLKGAFRKMIAHKEHEPVAINQHRKEIPEPLVAIVSKLLSKLPEDRYATPELFCQAIAPFCSGSNLIKLADYDLEKLNNSDEKSAVLTKVNAIGDTDSIGSFHQKETLQAKPEKREGEVEPKAQFKKRYFLVAIAALTFAVFVAFQLFNGTPIKQENIQEGSMIFDGVDDFVETKFMYVDAIPITFEVWLTPEIVDPPRKMEIISNAETAGISLSIDANNKPFFQFHDGVYYVPHKHSAPIAPGVESHIAAVYDGISISVFINGKKQGRSVPVRRRHHPSPLPIYIGANPDPELQGRPQAGFRSLFQGTIRKVRFSKGAIYREDFEATEVTKSNPETMLLYFFNNGKEIKTVTDYSKNDQDGTIHGKEK